MKVRWSKKVDLVLLLLCEPEESVIRGGGGGPVVNPLILPIIRDAAREVYREHRASFNEVRMIETEAFSVEELSRLVNGHVLESLRAFATDNICVVPRAALPDFPAGHNITDRNVLTKLTSHIETSAQWLPNSLKEEANDIYVIVPGLVMTHNDDVLVLHTRDRGRTRDNTYSVWAGGRSTKGVVAAFFTWTRSCV